MSQLQTEEAKQDAPRKKTPSHKMIHYNLMFPTSQLDRDYGRSPTPPPTSGIPYFVYAGPACLHPDYVQWKLDDPEHFDLQNVSSIFSSAITSLSAAPVNLNLPSFNDVQRRQTMHSQFFQYSHDSLTYQGKLEYGAAWCSTRTCWVVNLRLSNNGFLYPHSNELKTIKIPPKPHHTNQPGWALVDEQSQGYFSVLTKYAASWMGKSLKARVMYNPLIQRLDIYFRPRNNEVSLSDVDDIAINDALLQPFSFNVHFEPGAPIDTFDDDLWQDVE